MQEIILRRIGRAKSFGILADEAADVAALQQLIILIKYVNPEVGEADLQDSCRPGVHMTPRCEC